MNQTRVNRNVKTYRMVVAALLCAVGILIPLTMPKIMIGPMSFTPASHVALFLAMFISPATAVFVSIGTTLGFFLAGLPIVVVLRAASQLVFVIVGALIIKARPNIVGNFATSALFCLLLNVIHAVAEVLVVTWFFFGDPSKYGGSYLSYVLLLVGLGTLIHGSADYIISSAVWYGVTKASAVDSISNAKFTRKASALKN